MADDYTFGGFGIHPTTPSFNNNENTYNPEPTPAPAPVFSPATPEPTPAPVEDPSTEETHNEESVPSEEPVKKPGRKAGRPSSGRSSARKAKATEGGITEATVALVRKYIAKADEADEKTKDVVRFLLGLKKGNDDALIAALADGESASKVSKAIDKEIALLDYNDIKAGAVLGGEEKAERKYHWQLAAAVDPEAAEALSPNGAYPTSRDVVDEAISVRELQKGIDGYRDVLTSVKSFIAG